MVDQPAVFREAVEPVRQAGARQGVEDGEAVARELRVGPLPVGRRGGKCQHVRQEVGDLVHHVDAHVVVLDPGMDVHAADQHPPGRRPHVVPEPVVAFLSRVALAAPGGEGVGRGGDDRIAMLPGCRRHRRAQGAQLAHRLGDAGMRPGADLDLALQEFGGDLVAHRLAAILEETGFGFGDQIAGLAIDDQVFLLDPEGQRRSLQAFLPCRQRRIVKRFRVRGQSPPHAACAPVREL